MWSENKVLTIMDLRIRVSLPEIAGLVSQCKSSKPMTIYRQLWELAVKVEFAQLSTHRMKGSMLPSSKLDTTLGEVSKRADAAAADEAIPPAVAGTGAAAAAAPRAITRPSPSFPLVARKLEPVLAISRLWVAFAAAYLRSWPCAAVEDEAAAGFRRAPKPTMPGPAVVTRLSLTGRSICCSVHRVAKMELVTKRGR